MEDFPGQGYYRYSLNSYKNPTLQPQWPSLVFLVHSLPLTCHTVRRCHCTNITHLSQPHRLKCDPSQRKFQCLFTYQVQTSGCVPTTRSHLTSRQVTCANDITRYVERSSTGVMRTRKQWTDKHLASISEYECLPNKPAVGTARSISHFAPYHHHHLALQPFVSLGLLCYSPPLVSILSFPSPSFNLS